MVCTRNFLTDDPYTRLNRFGVLRVGNPDAFMTVWPGFIQSWKKVLSGNDQYISLFKALV
tara:strand:+ start:455 stop:634 length:180 start_codon:yes stop_codon:yes gene_type:complete